MIEHQLSKKNPIIVTKISENISFSDCEKCFRFVDDILTKYDFPMVYWVIEAKKINMSYSDLIQVIDATNNELAGTGGDNRVIPLLVVVDEVYDYLHEEFKNRYNWVEFPKFNTLDQATSFVESISPNY